MVRYFLAAAIGISAGVTGLMPAEAAKPSAMTFPFVEQAADHDEVAVKFESSFAFFTQSNNKTVKDIAVARCTDSIQARANDKVYFETPYNLGGEISESWKQDLELCAQQDASCTSRARTMLGLWKRCMGSALQAARSLKSREESAALKHVELFPNS